ncbi:MAG: Lipase, class 2 [Chthoniobacter sp.]|nr:Lipase, class 2 [Chthoniobacter sp.]
MKLVGWISSTLALVDGAFAGPTASPKPECAPVVLVHGIYSSSRDMARMARHLRASGREVFTPDLSPNCGRARIDELAQQLADYTSTRLAGRKFDLVGFSMGGLVSRYYVQRLGGAERVGHFVTLSAPHQGTVLAEVNRLPGVVQMRRTSEFLRDLERDSHRLAKVKFTSFYTPLDLVIVPARSSEMQQARNVSIWAWSHPSMILEKRCIRAVAAVLES